MITKFIDKLRTYRRTSKPLGQMTSEDGHKDDKGIRVVQTREESNLITSTAADPSLASLGYHYPAIDFDGIPLRFIESSTPGNFHLYIDRQVHWEQYKSLLYALAAANLVQPGYVNASIDRGYTALRTRPDKKGYPDWEPARVEVSHTGMEYFPRQGNPEMIGLADTEALEATIGEL